MTEIRLLTYLESEKLVINTNQNELTYYFSDLS